MTSWTEPNEAFEKALEAWVRGALSAKSGEFLADMDRFVGTIARPGYWNALCRVMLHFTMPGTPDLYQGDELWAFALVDPDNRRPVDWERRERMLGEVERASTAEARGALLRDAVRAPEDGRVKLVITRALLHARRDHAALFCEGSYRPLEVTGRHAAHVVAFVREHGDERALVVAPRLTLALGSDGAAPVGARWGDTRLRVPDAFVRAEWRSVLTGAPLGAGSAAGDGLSLETLLADAPVGCWIAGGRG